jgi:hypothetical protein
MIYTSLNEIKSFNPCASGWRNILKGQGKTEADGVLFPLTDAVKSNSVADVCWLLGKRKKEIQVCVRFARMCADSVKHLQNNRAAAADAAADATYADAYAAYAAYADATYAAAYAAADAAAADAADAAADAADAAYAAADATYADAYADAADAAAADATYFEQNEKNKQFLIQCITEWEGE